MTTVLEPACPTAQTQAAVARIAATPVHLVGIRPAGEVCPELADGRTLLHAGPPLAGAAPVPAMLGALVGCLLYEGTAGSPEQARQLIESGAVTLASCHESGGVGALTGAVTAATPVVVVEREGGRRAWAPVIEGVGKAIRFGNFDPATIDRLRQIARAVAPALDRAVRAGAPVDLVEMQAAALRRGDEGHNRNVAATSMLATRIAPDVLRVNDNPAALAVLQELADNHHFFLALSMAAAKANADELHAAGPPGLVTAMCSNGHGVGIRVSGTDGWFLGRAEPELLEGIGGYLPADFAAPMGDSPVTETVGLGAMALSAAPSLGKMLGRTVQQCRDLVTQMRRICVTEHPAFQIPDLDFAPSPLGISVERVLATGIRPGFTTGFSHRDFGVGRAGFGLVRVAEAAFRDAAAALAHTATGHRREARA